MLFYDFEVFAYDWLVVGIDIFTGQVYEIENDKEGLLQLYENYKSTLWVGYNNIHYDQYIMKAIMLDMNAKKVNDWIIKKKMPGWKYSDLFRKVQMYNYDTMQRTDRGLKAFEGFMGKSIKETSVPFDIQRKLTPEEIKKEFKYCRYDVENTIDLFMERKSEFDVMMFFIKHFKFPMSDFSKTKAQLAAKILGANGKGHQFNDEFEITILSCLRLGKYQYIADWYKKPDNHSYEKHQNTVIFGVPHINSWGGGHGAIKKYHAKGIFLLIDVTAYYPSTQYEYEFGRRVMDNWENFKFIHESNISFKRAGDKKKRQPFKIMDNSISGQLKRKESPMFDPRSNNEICINGQLLLIDLIEKLERSKTCELVQNNTDGLIIRLFDYDDFEKIDDIVYEWECRTGMQMDIDQFIGEIYQKDVNNYMIVDRENGAIKRKGLWLKNLSRIDYDLPIVNKALVDYMVNNIPVEKTINSCNSLIEFQQIKKISEKYECITHNGARLKEKCVRCFASNDWADGGLYKIKASTGSFEKVDTTPEHCFLDNGSVIEKEVPKKLDKQWYIDKAKERLSKFGVDVR